MKVKVPLFQFLPSFKGKMRLGKLLYSKSIGTHSEQTFLLKENNLKITVPNLLENVSFELFLNGNYEKETIDFFINSIPKNAVFFDIGANIGAFSFTIAKQRPDVNIFAFEAVPFVFQYLKLNIEQNNLNNVVCINKAIHFEDNITLPFYSSKEKNGKGSFSKVFSEEATYVQTLNLDKFIVENNVRPTFMKIDVEGYEKLIFESMQIFLQESTDTQLVFEFVDWAEDLSLHYKAGDAQKYLQQLGYKLFEFNKNKVILYSIPKSKGNYNILAKKQLLLEAV